MEPIWQWGNNIIVSIQTVHNPALDGFFNAVTFLGEPEFFLILFPLIIWSINKSVGQRLAYLMLIGLTLNTWAKELIGHPRPYEWPSVETSPVLKLNQQAHPVIAFQRVSMALCRMDRRFDFGSPRRHR